jgi:hypothetical protein
MTHTALYLGGFYMAHSALYLGGYTLQEYSDDGFREH